MDRCGDVWIATSGDFWNALVAFGTIALALLAIYGDTIKSWLRGPRFAVSAVCAPPDCVSVPTDRVENGRTVATAATIYLRVLITNVGNDTAKHVEVFAESLTRLRTDKNWERVSEFPPMNLIWSNLGAMYLRQIAPQTARHCDVAHIIDPAERANFWQENQRLSLKPQQASMEFDVIRKPNHKGHIVGPGTYRVELTVAAANAKPQKYTVEITLQGSWSPNEDQMLRDGVGIRVLD